MEFETVSVVPRGLAAGKKKTKKKNSKARRFETIMQVRKFSFLIVAIRSQVSTSVSHPVSCPGLRGTESRDPLSNRIGPGHVNKNLIVATSRLLLQSRSQAT